MAIEFIGSDFLRKVRPYYRLAIGQHAAPHPNHDIKAYDLMLSSLPNFVDAYRNGGMKSEFFRLGFEPRILNHLSPEEKRSDIVFIGGVGGPHQGSSALIEFLCQRFNIALWGYEKEKLSKTSSIKKAYKGPIWGIEMYQALQNGKIGFNRHIGVARDYANNMRLYEVTGVGTLLLTDYKKNLAKIFQPGKECLAYKDDRECLSLAEYYMTHHKEREDIAQAGHARTLAEHTWRHRMEELLGIIKKHI
ncbi:Spore protein ykvP [sediment metagenome]|uniref:Spore protein ykvP n=1 Tax=sediment metagenome TaxID=749907 RepID=D9PM57_9ZZZZ